MTHPTEPEAKSVSARIDHGTANQAIEWAVHVNRDAQEREFLDAWQQGDLDEWPEYYEWLEAQPTLTPAAEAGDREALARALWFDFVDQHRNLNGLPTWDEMVACPASDRNNWCAEFLSLADAAIAAFSSRRAAEIEHWSDCAVNNEPAHPVGQCDCGGYSLLKDRERLATIFAEALAISDGLKFGPYKPWERHGYVAADALLAALTMPAAAEERS